MFRTTDAVLTTLCNLRMTRGSYLSEYRTKVAYGYKMMGAVESGAMLCLTF